MATLLATFPRAQKDPLAAEIGRWSSVIATDTRTDPLWLEARKSSEAALEQAEDALRHGLRLVALERLAAVNQLLGAALYVSQRPADERKSLPAFEAEWTRVGGVLHDVVSPGGRTAESLATIRPALARALAELSTSQARESYAASLEYGRNTEPQYGLYYLGAAQAHRGFLELARAMPPSTAGRTPPLRVLRPDIDALQATLLTAYRPPASIDRHSDFIVASSALKEAREQDVAGHRHAALLRYLQAAQRTAMLRKAEPADMSDVRRRLEELDSRLRNAGIDHTLGSSSSSGRMRRLPPAAAQPARPRPRRSPLMSSLAILRRSSLLVRPLLRKRLASRSRWSAGPSRETSPTQRLCWHEASSRNSMARRVLLRRTTVIPSARDASA
jgi:hypothetical protein